MDEVTLFDAGFWVGLGFTLGAAAMWAIIVTVAGAIKWIGRSFRDRCLRWDNVTAFFWDRDLDEVDTAQKNR